MWANTKPVGKTESTAATKVTAKATIMLRFFGKKNQTKKGVFHSIF